MPRASPDLMFSSKQGLREAADRRCVFVSQRAFVPETSTRHMTGKHRAGTQVHQVNTATQKPFRCSYKGDLGYKATYEYDRHAVMSNIRALDSE